jgi:Ankyrin repeat
VTISYSHFEDTLNLCNSIENIFPRCYAVSFFPLAYAAAQDVLVVVKFLVNKGADVNIAGGAFGSALQAAAPSRRGNSVATGDFLIKNGADVNAQGGLFRNAFQAAVACDTRDFVKILQLHRAELDPPGAEWESFLDSIGTKLAADDGSIYYPLDITLSKTYVARLKEFRRPQKLVGGGV